MKLSLVVPCYNEEEVLPETHSRLLKLRAELAEKGKIDAASRIYYVDDGSRDRTWELIEEYASSGDGVHGLKLSRNRGHQNALIAGLQTAEGDAVVSVDADLQDDLGAIERMVDAFAAGAEVVYGVRSNRDSDSFFKRFSAQSYYHLIRALGVDAVMDHADYRLLSRQALESLKHYREVNLFLRGIVPLLGYKTERVYYVRAERFAGESKYPLRKMLALALDGITSFSAAPLRLITLLGFTFFVVSTVMGLWALGTKIFSDAAVVPGWASTVIPTYILGGLQLLSLGVIGEYLAKIYIEVKDRPRYFIEKQV